MSCETRTDSAGREVSDCTLAPGGGAVVHAWHSNLAPFPPHSLCRPRLSLSVRPSTRLSYNCGQRSKWQWAMLYPRPLALIRGGFAWMDGPAAAAALLRCSGFWMASQLLPPPHSEPRIITLLEVTPSRPPIVGTRPKCEERQDIFHLQEQLQRQPRVLLRPLLCLPYEEAICPFV